MMASMYEMIGLTSAGSSHFLYNHGTLFSVSSWWRLFALEVRQSLAVLALDHR